MDGKGETGGLQRSHGAHPERTGQAQNGRVTSRLPGNGNFSPVNVGKRETAIERLCMETASMAVFAPRMHGVIVILFPTINPPFYSKIIFLVTDKYRIAEYLQHSLWENLYLSAHHNDGRW